MEKIDFKSALTCALLCKSSFKDLTFRVDWQEVFTAVYGPSWDKWELDGKAKHLMALRWWQRVNNVKGPIEINGQKVIRDGRVQMVESRVIIDLINKIEDVGFPFSVKMDSSGVQELKKELQQSDLESKLNLRGGFDTFVKVDGMNVSNALINSAKELYLLLSFVSYMIKAYEEEGNLNLPTNLPIEGESQKTKKQIEYSNLLNNMYDSENYDGNKLLHKLCALNPLLLAVCGLEDVYDRALKWVLSKVEPTQILECNNYNMTPVELCIKSFNGTCLSKVMKVMPKEGFTKEGSEQGSVYTNRLISLLTTGCIESDYVLNGALFSIDDKSVLKRKLIENMKFCARDWIRQSPQSVLKSFEKKELTLSFENFNSLISYAGYDVEYDGDDLRLSWLLKMVCQNSTLPPAQIKMNFDEVLCWLSILEEEVGLKAWKISPVHIHKKDDMLGSVITIKTISKKASVQGESAKIDKNVNGKRQILSDYGVDLNEIVSDLEKEEKNRGLKFNNLASVATYIELPVFFTSVLIEHLKSLTEKEKLAKIIKENKMKTKKISVL